MYIYIYRPVSLGCRIRQLHLCRGLRPPSPNEATCWLWVATSKVLGRNPGGWAVIDPATEWSMACNTPLWPALALTGSRTGPIWSIGWSRHALVHVCFSPDRIILSALVELLDLFLWNYSQPFILYVLEAGRWGSIVLRDNTFDRC